MTQTEYTAAVTTILADRFGPDYEFPASFDADAAACFTRRLTAEQAADKLAEEYAVPQ